MEQNIQKEVTNKDVYKHYFSSLIVYGAVLLFIIFCPLLTQNIDYPIFNYVTFFIMYYICYAVLALPIYMWIKPESVLVSRNAAIIDYIKRQFSKTESTQDFLNNIEPKENEKQAMVILFIKAFFGVYFVNALCNKYLPALGYDFDFMKEMFVQAVNYASTEGLFMGICQYIDDTADMWVTLTLTVSYLVFAFSYLSELDLFKNKIKTADTTPLGILSCIMCYYPISILTNKLLPNYNDQLLPVPNFALRIVLNLLVVIVNILALVSIVRLGTKSGNLTNRGIVTSFPYNIIRHPNYSMQICYIILTTIPIYFMADFNVFEKLLLTAGVALWIFIYYLRSITEERLLIKDEAYREYTEKVKYRFIPKIF